ncbi:UNVERIFIED_CONTAM: Nuclear pore complex protein A [Sesamum angustifolium]|uniref:Nuclear pore complex protein A n=1 Tax=Sesamum angustifolium TaxID=2727405 RepID=A0AAW2RLV6_9LAMI
MGDTENDLQPSKKRAAGVQLSRDNPGLDDDEETSEQEAGTFKRASDEVLATRRIVKVRRQQSSSTPSATEPTPTSNPFSAIRLVPPASAPVVEAVASHVTSKENEQSDKNSTESENVSDEPKGESSADVKPSESKVDESKVEFNSEKDESNIVGEQSITKSAVGEVTEGEESGLLPKKLQKLTILRMSLGRMSMARKMLRRKVTGRQLLRRLQTLPHLAHFNNSRVAKMLSPVLLGQDSPVPHSHLDHSLKMGLL